MLNRDRRSNAQGQNFGKVADADDTKSLTTIVEYQHKLPKSSRHRHSGIVNFLTVKAASFQGGRQKYEKKGNRFGKLKSTIVVVGGQRDSEAEEVEKR